VIFIMPALFCLPPHLTDKSLEKMVQKHLTKFMQSEKEWLTDVFEDRINPSGPPLRDIDPKDPIDRREMSTLLLNMLRVARDRIDPFYDPEEMISSTEPIANLLHRRVIPYPITADRVSAVLERTMIAERLADPLFNDILAPSGLVFDPTERVNIQEDNNVFNICSVQARKFMKQSYHDFLKRYS